MLSNVISQLWQNLLKLFQKLKHHCPQKVRDGCLIVFDNIILYSGGCYEMLLCFLLARGCPGGMEHAAASQLWLRLLGGPSTVTGDALQIEVVPGFVCLSGWPWRRMVKK